MGLRGRRGGRRFQLLSTSSSRPASAALILIVTQAVYNGGLAIEVILLGRWLGEVSLAEYFVAPSLAALFEVGVHFGSQHLLNREASVRYDALRRLLPTLLVAAATTLLVALGVIGVLRGWIIAVIAGGTLIRAIAALLGAIFIGRGDI